MKIIIGIIIILSPIFSTFAQSYDSLYLQLRGKKINLIDENDQKQGIWRIYRIPLCHNDSSDFLANPKNHPISYIAKGEYANDQKIGKWEYYVSDYNPCSKEEQQVTESVYKTETFTQDSIFIDYLWQYNITISRDTSYIKAVMYFRHPKICVGCEKKSNENITNCFLYGGKNSEFIRKRYVFDNNKDVFDFLENGCIILF